MTAITDFIRLFNQKQVYMSDMSRRNQDNRTSKGALLAGFSSIVALLLIISALSIYSLDNSVSRLQHVTNTTAEQEDLLKTMHNSARDRIITLYQMSTTDDPFTKDELWLRFNAGGTSYITSRNKLYSLDIDETLRSLLQEQDKILMPLGRIQLEIANNLLTDNNKKARELLISQAAPLQKGVLDYFHEMRAIVKAKDIQAIKASFDQADKTKSNIIALSILGLLFTISVASFVFQRVRAYESRILNDKERAQVTLHSIVDGVIVINQFGVVVELNDAALNMLRLDKDAALYKHINEVIHFRNKSDDETSHELNLDAVFNAEVEVSEGGVELLRNNQKNLIIEYSLSPVIIDQKVSSAVLVMHDISAMHMLTQELDYQATHDPLTGILNRRRFEEILESTLTNTRRQADAQSWLCYIDLDRFKQVNDTCGHLSGDQFLKQIADRISSAVRDTDRVARMGGDEFAVILQSSGMDDVLVVAERVRTNIAAMEFLCGSHRFDVTASLGLVSLDASVTDVDSALSYA
ncbi:MAG: sensor domain-containing diguanylate cyclase, partial [Gammaproteobacteria bacterium]|nr:sensor domain-containing diguanylate cyclase [Gammaproteobacteria bacterium]